MLYSRGCCFFYLDTFFFELDLDSELFSNHDIRVVSVLEGSLQLVQLVLGEYCAVSSLAFL